MLRRFGALSASVVRRYTRDVLRGLSYLHSNDVVHGDLRPATVLLSHTGDCKLTGFGVLREIGAVLTHSFYFFSRRRMGASSPLLRSQ